jgi:ATP-binding cassette, subfamily B, bacterial
MNSFDSGIICLKMIAAHYGKDYSIDFLKTICTTYDSVMNLQQISSISERIGLKCTTIEINYSQLVEEIHFPLIIPWQQQYFVVLYDVKVSFWAFLPWVNKEEKFIIANPKSNLIIVDKKTFLTSWLKENSNKGIALLFENYVEF